MDRLESRQGLHSSGAHIRSPSSSVFPRRACWGREPEASKVNLQPQEELEAEELGELPPVKVAFGHEGAQSSDV